MDSDAEKRLRGKNIAAAFEWNTKEQVSINYYAIAESTSELDWVGKPQSLARRVRKYSMPLELQPSAQLLVEGLTIDSGDSADDLENQSLFYRSELGFDAGRCIETSSLPFLKRKVSIEQNR